MFSPRTSSEETSGTPRSGLSPSGLVSGEVSDGSPVGMEPEMPFLAKGKSTGSTSDLKFAYQTLYGKDASLEHKNRSASADALKKKLELNFFKRDDDQTSPHSSLAVVPALPPKPNKKKAPPSNQGRVSAEIVGAILHDEEVDLSAFIGHGGGGFDPLQTVKLPPGLSSWETTESTESSVSGADGGITSSEGDGKVAFDPFKRLDPRRREDTVASSAISALANPILENVVYEHDPTKGKPRKNFLRYGLWNCTETTVSVKVFRASDKTRDILKIHACSGKLDPGTKWVYETVWKDTTLVVKVKGEGAPKTLQTFKNVKRYSEGERSISWHKIKYGAGAGQWVLEVWEEGRAIEEAEKERTGRRRAATAKTSSVPNLLSIPNPLTELGSRQRTPSVSSRSSSRSPSPRSSSARDKSTSPSRKLSSPRKSASPRPKSPSPRRKSPRREVASPKPSKSRGDGRKSITERIQSIAGVELEVRLFVAACPSDWIGQEKRLAKNCSVCSKKFKGLGAKKRNCRTCGCVVCPKCSEDKYLRIKGRHGLVVCRVCVACVGTAQESRESLFTRTILKKRQEEGISSSDGDLTCPIDFEAVKEHRIVTDEVGDHRIEYSDLELENPPVGVGAFGVVHKAMYNGELVAVKTFRTSSTGTKVEFTAEVRTLSQLSHPNVIRFLGACLVPLAIVTEFAERGSLQSFILTCDGQLEYNTPEGRKLALRILIGIAKGMAYLHSQKPPLVHRDLKSGNVLLTRDMQVKICDFGLTRPMAFNGMMTSRQGTIGWTAPEVMSSSRDTKYGCSVDVYSFAVVIWEVLARSVPWAGFKWDYQIEDKVLAGERPPLDESWDPALVALIRVCWDVDADNRPSFEFVVDSINEILCL